MDHARKRLLRRLKVAYSRPLLRRCFIFRFVLFISTPTPLALAVNIKTPRGFYFLWLALDGLWRENRGSVNRLPPLRVYGALATTTVTETRTSKKAIPLLSKTTTLHVHHAFLYISSPSLHDYDAKIPNFTFYGGRIKTSNDEIFFRLFLNLNEVPKLRNPLQRVPPTFDIFSELV